MSPVKGYIIMNKILIILIFPYFCFAQSYKHTAITITGGVSLGVYEAGFLYEAIRLSKKAPLPETIYTGASAGAMNSFISIMEACSIEEKKMKESLFWTSWENLNIDDFYISEDKKTSSLLSRKSFIELFSNIEKAWKAGLKKGCKSYLGLSVTRKTPLNYINGKKLLSPRTIESFYFLITGKGKGIVPKIENINLNDGSIHAYLPLRKTGNFKFIKNIMLASSSFPLAFEPEKVEHCLIYPKDKNKCDKKNLRSDYFIDGGVFNNGPLDIAHQIAKSLGRAKETNFLFFDPEITNYPIIEKEESEKKPGITNNIMSFVTNFILSSRSTKISSFLGNNPDVEKRLQLIKGEMPLASDQIAGFFGFFEKDFRVFDFLIGVANARKNLLSTNGVEYDYSRRNHWSDQFVACYVALQNVELSQIKNCEFGSSNFDILFKVSLERLFENCRQLEPGYEIENKLCAYANIGNKLTSLFPGWDTKYFKRDNELELDYLMRRLDFYRFEFIDLDLEKSEAQLGLVRVKEKLKTAIHLAASNQNKGEEILLKGLSSPMLNFLNYSPDPKDGYLLFGSRSFDFGLTMAFSKKSINSLYHRFNLGLSINGINSYESDDSWEFGFVPYLGYQYEIKGLSSSTIQYFIGARLGYQFSSKQKFKLNECNVDTNFSDSFPHCSGAIAMGTIGVDLFDTIRLQLNGQKSFKKNQFDKNLFYTSFLVGFLL